MARTRKLEIIIAGDAKSALGAFGEVERGASGLGDKLKTTGGKIAGFGAKASLAVTLPMVALGKAAFGEAEEAQKVAKQTEAVVRSTGGAANVSVGQVGALADKLSKLSGVDDELIQTNANVLLTFTRIRNEVGKGNDIFDQASLAALNMSTALGTDLQGATVMVGKALNDPIRGIAAMTRAGVQFTDQQKDQIASLVESGDMLGAQKIILGELETQFGGSAAAQATAADKAKVAWGNFQESIGAVLLPFIEKAASFLGDLAGKFGELSPKVQTMVVIGAGLAAALGPVLTVIGGLVTVIGFLISPIGLVVAALAGLVAAAIYAYKNFEGFRTVVDGVVSWLRDNVPGIFEAIKNAVVGAFNWIRDNVVPVVQTVAQFVLDKFGALVAWVVTMWPQISEAISHVMNVVAGVIRTVVDVVSALWRAWGDDLLNVARTAFEFIRSTIENVINVVRGIIQTVLAVINGDWGRAWNGIKGVLSAVWDQMRNIVATVFNIISSAIGGVLSTIGQVWRGAWGGIRDFLFGVWERIKGIASGAVNAVLGTVRGVLGTIRSVWDTAWWAMETTVRTVRDAISRIWDGIKRVVGAPINVVVGFVNTLGGGINKVTDFLGMGRPVPVLPRVAFHSGGVVGEGAGDRLGRTGGLRADELTAILQKGEGVLPKDAMAVLGKDRFEELRNARPTFITELAAGTAPIDREPTGRPEIGGFPGSGIIKDLLQKGIDAVLDNAQKIVRGVMEAITAPLQAFGNPGRIGGGLFRTGGNAAIKWLDSLKSEASQAKEALGEGPPLSGGIGWRAMWDALRRAFPTARLHSAYRPGAITATGRASYHGMGRAIDVSPWASIAEWIRKNYMGQTREMIFSPMGGRQINNGRNHYYTGITRSMHWDHVHWAMANGGRALANRLQLVGENGPELVVPKAPMLTLDQERTARVLGGDGASSGEIHLHFHGPVDQDGVRWVVAKIAEAKRKGYTTV